MRFDDIGISLRAKHYGHSHTRMLVVKRKSAAVSAAHHVIYMALQVPAEHGFACGHREQTPFANTPVLSHCSVIYSSPSVLQANSTYLIYLLLGTAVLFPWNAFITAADYFEFEFPVLSAVPALGLHKLPTHTMPPHTVLKPLAGSPYGQAHHSMLPSGNTGDAVDHDPLQPLYQPDTANFTGDGWLFLLNDSCTSGERQCHTSAGPQ